MIERILEFIDQALMLDLSKNQLKLLQAVARFASWGNGLKTDTLSDKALFEKYHIRPAKIRDARKELIALGLIDAVGDRGHFSYRLIPFWEKGDKKQEEEIRSQEPENKVKPAGMPGTECRGEDEKGTVSVVKEPNRSQGNRFGRKGTVSVPSENKKKVFPLQSPFKEEYIYIILNNNNFLFSFSGSIYYSSLVNVSYLEQFTFQKLTSQGISEKSAGELMKKFSCWYLLRYCSWQNFYLAEMEESGKPVTSPGGILFRAIQDGRAKPRAIEKSRKIRKVNQVVSIRRKQEESRITDEQKRLKQVYRGLSMAERKEFFGWLRRTKPWISLEGVKDGERLARMEEWIRHQVISQLGEWEKVRRDIEKPGKGKT